MPLPRGVADHPQAPQQFCREATPSSGGSNAISPGSSTRHPAPIVVTLETGGRSRDAPLTEKAGDYWFAAIELNSVREPLTEFKPERIRRRSGDCFQIRKLSNKLSTHDWAHSANRQLARQVHRRHVLTLWDTTGWCSRRESNPEPWDYEEIDRPCLDVSGHVKTCLTHSAV
jgi:hypothetical protein